MSANAIPIPPYVPTGAIKTFGPVGEMYEVGEALRPLADGDWMVSITLVKTGEVTEYRLTHVMDDPEAQ
jgi:hypothetical protein